MSATHRLPKRRPLPETIRVAALPHGSVLFIWALRRWRLAEARGETPTVALRPPYAAADCEDAVGLLDELLNVIVVSSERSFEIKGVHGQTLSADERLLLRLIVSLNRADLPTAGAIAAELVRPRFRSLVLRLASWYVAALKRSGLDPDVTPELRLVV